MVDLAAGSVLQLVFAPSDGLHSPFGMVSDGPVLARHRCWRKSFTKFWRRLDPNV